MERKMRGWASTPEPGVGLLSMTVHGTDTTNTYYYLTDHLGSIHAVVDESGHIVGIMASNIGSLCRLKALVQ